MKEFRVVNGKKLRCGYTTGTTAAAAACGALTGLLSGELQKQVKLTLPINQDAVLNLENFNLGKNYASCSVIKDGGDDPDITHGTHIFAHVSFFDSPSEEYLKESKLCDLGFSDDRLGNDELYDKKIIRLSSNIYLRGGYGVGKVTQKGLQCQVGEPAINPIPRKMIGENCSKILEKYDCNRKILIEIAVPKGRELARKTFNPRLGIIGGISILGTTGIVEPMSERALVDTIKTEIDSKCAADGEYMLISPGNYGSDFCKNYLRLNIDNAVQISNYVGEALDYIKYKGIKNILFVGHTGKLVKLAAAVMNTHSLYADGRMEIIALYSGLCGADVETMEKILGCITTDQAFDLIKDRPFYGKVKERILEKAMFAIENRLKDEGIRVEVVMFTTDKEHIIKSKGAEEFIEHFRCDEEKQLYEEKQL